MMKLGITQYAASRDGKGAVEIAAGLGLAGVEPYVTDELPFYSMSPQELAKFRDDAARQGIEVPSVCLGHFNGDASIVTEDGFDKAVEIVSHVLRLTSALGAKVLLLCTFVASHPDTPEKRRCLANVVKAVEPLARNLGVKIALETPLPAEEIGGIVDEIASDQVGIYYDFGNAIAMGFDPAREIPLLGKRILAIHVKDSVSSKLGGLHLGDGQLDLAAAMQATKGIGFDGWLSIETPCESEAKLLRDVEQLRRHLW